MQPFNQSENAYTATARTVAFDATSADYDVDKLDNPVRRKINVAVIEANNQFYRRGIAI